MIEKFEDPAAAPVRAPRFPRDAELMEEVRQRLILKRDVQHCSGAAGAGGGAAQ